MVTARELDSWCTWLRAAGRPETTVRLRRYHVQRVMAGVGVDPWQLDAEQLQGWLASQPWAPETRRAYRASLRAFYSWAQATGRRADSPAHLLPVVRVPRGVPRPTPDAIYRDALAAATPRVRLMLQLGAVLGLRRGEIAALRREDVLPDQVPGLWSLRVLGKGGHVRMVPLPAYLAQQLLAQPAGWLFPSPHRAGHLTPAHVGKLVSATLPEGWTCHTLRHRCATVAYRGTRDLRAVQQLLGHAKPETTARYTQVPDDAVRDAVRCAAGA